MSKIEWTNETWNPLRGCRRISPGCERCYAERQAARPILSGPGKPYEGLVRSAKRPGGGTLVKWTGATVGPDQFDVPLSWKKPRKIFVCSMSDLFYEGHTDEQIDQVLAVMLLSPQHTFQVLTKRPERMSTYLRDMRLYQRVLRCVDAIRAGRPALTSIGVSDPTLCPSRWIWWGCSVEDQQRADERLPHLLQVPAVVRFVSYEPALGPVDFRPWLGRRAWWCSECRVPVELGETFGSCPKCSKPMEAHQGGVDWLIVGGESGPGARPFDVAWMRSAVKQCRAAGVPVFCKQVGANVRDRNDTGFEAENEVWADGPDAGQPTEPRAWPTPQDIEHSPDGVLEEYQGAPVRIRLRDRKGGDMAEWPADLRVREWPGGTS